MRPVILLTSLLALGCALGSRPSEVCEAYLDCLAESDADAFTAASPVYGAGGSCWDGDAEACETACVTGHRAAGSARPTVETCTTLADGSHVLASGDYAMEPVGTAESDCEEPSQFRAATVVVSAHDAGDGFTLVIPGSTDFTFECYLDGNDFDCESPALEFDEDRAQVRIAWGLRGELTSPESFDGRLSVDTSCEGSDCAAYGEWCSVAQDVEAARE